MSEPATGDLLVGIDLGTTVCKCFIFDSKQHVLGSASRNIPLITLSGREIEQDAELWWAITREVVREAVGKPGVQAERIRGLSVSTQGISFVPVDADCRPLRRAGERFPWPRDHRDRLVDIGHVVHARRARPLLCQSRRR